MGEVTRRTAVRAGAGTAAALLASGGMLIQSTEPAIAASGDLTAEDVSVSSDDGSLSSLTVAPSVTVSWDGQDSQVAEIQATWKVKTDGTSETTVGKTPYYIPVEPSTTSGSVDHTFDEINLLNALSASNFAASTDSTSKSTAVELSMDVDLMDSSSNKIVRV